MACAPAAHKHIDPTNNKLARRAARNQINAQTMATMNIAPAARVGGIALCMAHVATLIGSFMKNLNDALSPGMPQR